MTGLRHIKCFILDMDGTFYLGNKILPGARYFMEYLQYTNRDYLFLTNNSSRSADYYATKLAGMGWPVCDDKIVTAGEATALHLKAVKPGARIYLLGTPALSDEFTAHGFILTDEAPDYVVLGFDTTLTYQKLVTACNLIRNGVPFIATHPDFNCPTEDGYIPDCGAMIALIKASTGVTPTVIGKPNSAIIDILFSRLPYAKRQLAMVGDRLYTDIATGVNAGISSILVLSGETKAEDVAKSTIKPDFIFADLGSLARALQAEDEAAKG